MAVQRDPGTYSTTPKKKKKSPAKPPAPVAEVIQQVTQSAKATTKANAAIAKATELATDTTQTISKLSDPKVSHKKKKEIKDKLRTDQAFSGTKKPEGKKEKRLAHKGKEIAKILGIKQSPEILPYKHVKTPQLRVAQIANLEKARKDLTYKLDKEAGPNVQGGVRSARVKDLISQYDAVNLKLTQLKKQSTAKEIKQTEKVIDNVRKFKHHGGLSKAGKKVLKDQRKHLRDLSFKEIQLSGKEQTRRADAEYSAQQRQEQLANVEQILKDASSDPTVLEERGIRQRGQYEDARIKIPGVPGWQDFNAAKPSGALEDAADMAQWFPVGGAAAATLLRAGKLGIEGTRAGEAAIKGLQAAGKLGSAPIKKGAANLGTKALKGISPLITKSAKVTATTAAAKAALQKASDKVLKQVASEEGSITLKTGSVMENSTKYADVQSSRHAFEIGSAIDDALIASARKVVSTIPSDIDGFRVAGASLGRKAIKGGAFVGTFAIAPQLIQGKPLDEAARTVYRDAYDFVVGVVPSTYQIGAAGYEALHGDFDRAEELKNAFLKYDPIGLAFQGKWDEALAAYNERPFSTSLELAGVEYGLGRTLGAGMRKLPEGLGSSLPLVGEGGLRQAASLPNLRSLGPLDTKATDISMYSPDVLRKGLQRGTEGALGKVSPKALEAIEKSKTLKKVFERVDSMKGIQQSAQLRKLQDNLNVHKEFYQRADKIGGDAAANALPFMITRIARNPKYAVEDLTRYRDELLTRYNKRKRSTKAKIQEQQIYTHETIRVLNEILENPKMLSDQKLWDVADDYSLFEDSRQAALTFNSSLNKQQSEAASWIPYVVQHLGGKRLYAGKGGWKVSVQLRGPGGKFASKTLDLSKPADLDLIKAYAEKDGVAAPSFFRLQGLNETLIPEAKRFQGRGMAFQSRSHKSLLLGTYDPTFKALFSHSMRVDHSLLDGEFAIQMANEFTPLRRHPDTGAIELKGLKVVGPDTDLEGSIPALGTKGAIEDELYKHGLEDDYLAFNLDVFRERLASLRGLGESISSKEERMNATESGAMADAIKAAKDSTQQGERFIAMPKAVIQRLHSHARVDDLFYRNKAGKFVRQTNSVFKGAVLPFNPHWGLGNTVDMTFRMMFDQSGGPAEWAYNWNRGRKALKDLKARDESAYWQEMDRMGHGFQTQAFEGIQSDRFLTNTEKEVLKERYEIQRQMDGWQSSPQVKATQIQRSLGIAKGLPFYVKKAYRMAQEYNPAGFKWQQLIEKNVRQAAYGKHDASLLNQLSKKFEESTLITPKVIEDTTLMRSNSDVQNALAERVNGALGDYSRMSPAMRMAVASYAPFALWLRASVNWVLTLPAKHPMQTAVVASLSRMTEPQRRELGLSELHPVFATKKSGMEGYTKQQITKDPYLQGSLDLGNGLYPTQTLSSFGTFNEPGIGGMSSFLLPQIQSSVLMVGKGLDWTGKELTYPDGSKPTQWQLNGIALSNLTETFFPAFRWWKIYQAEGAPDETATWWDPKPQGLRDTYVNPAIPSARYEQGERNPLEQIFSPLKIVPTEYPKSKKLPPAPAGFPAYNLGVAERAKIMENGEPKPWIKSDVNADPDRPWLKAAPKDVATRDKKKPWIK